MKGNIKAFFSKLSAKNKKSLVSSMWMIITQVIIAFGVCFLIATVVITSESRRNYEIREAETIISSISGSINSNMDNYKDLSRLIMLNEKVISFLRADEPNDGVMNDARYGVLDVLNVCNNVDSVFIFRNDGIHMSTGRTEYIVNTSLMSEDEWKNPLYSLRGGAMVAMNGDGAVIRRNSTPIITIERSIFDIYTQRQTGILLMNISIDMLKRVVEDQSTGNVAIFSNDGTLLAGNDTLTPYFSVNSDGGEVRHESVYMGMRKRLITTYSFEDMPITIVCASTSATHAIPASIIFALILMFAVFALVVYSSSTFIVKDVTTPVLSLSEAINDTQKSGWMKKIEMEMPPNEIGTLADNYNSMIEYLNNLFTELIEQEKTVQRAEMRVLQEQIKPHFLYNSLGCISYMALEDNAQDVYEALETLGSFYRNFLSKGDREIPLEREVKIVKDYLALQKLRYGDIIEDEYDIAEDTLNRHIPKLILQPLVENSIYHGIRLKGEKGIIRITSRMEENVLHIIVRDTGVGMSEEGIKDALRGENVDKNISEEYKGSGFGLRGTIDRIRYYCDKPDAVTIRSEEGEYTEIEITIPYETRETEVEECTE